MCQYCTIKTVFTSTINSQHGNQWMLKYNRTTLKHTSNTRIYFQNINGLQTQQMGQNCAYMQNIHCDIFGAMVS